MYSIDIQRESFILLEIAKHNLPRHLSQWECPYGMQYSCSLNYVLMLHTLLQSCHPASFPEEPNYQCQCCDADLYSAFLTISLYNEPRYCCNCDANQFFSRKMNSTGNSSHSSTWQQGCAEGEGPPIAVVWQIMQYMKQKKCQDVTEHCKQSTKNTITRIIPCLGW